MDGNVAQVRVTRIFCSDESTFYEMHPDKMRLTTTELLIFQLTEIQIVIVVHPLFECIHTCTYIVHLISIHRNAATRTNIVIPILSA